MQLKHFKLTYTDTCTVTRGLLDNLNDEDQNVRMAARVAAAYTFSMYDILTTSGLRKVGPIDHEASEIRLIFRGILFDIWPDIGPEYQNHFSAVLDDLKHYRHPEWVHIPEDKKATVYAQVTLDKENYGSIRRKALLMEAREMERRSNGKYLAELAAKSDADYEGQNIKGEL